MMSRASCGQGEAKIGWMEGFFLSFLIFTGSTYFWARGSSQENQKKKAMQVGGEMGGGSRGSEVDGCRGEEVVALS